MILGAREKTVLRILSNNGRASLTEIAKKIGFSYVTAGKIVEVLRKEFGIKFTIEVAPVLSRQKLGYALLLALIFVFGALPFLVLNLVKL